MKNSPRTVRALLLAAAAVLLLSLTVSAAGASVRGDFDRDGVLTSADANYLLRHILLGGLYAVDQSPDVNGDGSGDSSDAVYLLRSVLLGEKDYPLVPDPGSSGITGSFRFPLTFDESPVESGFTYSDGYFSGSSYDFNIDLARFALRASLAAYSGTDTENGENIVALLKNTGFSSITVNYQKTSSDSAGYAIGSKKLTCDGSEYTLITAAIRGGGYDAEWAGNVNVGTSGDHKGFSLAAQTVSSAIVKYISANGISGNIKLFICGYSRGGAIADLLGYSLDRAASARKIAGLLPENIYTYTFESPAGAVGEQSATYGGKLLSGNIFNIINPVDLVAYLAPSGWGFGRYGVTCLLPDSSDPAVLTGEAYKAMQARYEELAKSFGLSALPAEATVPLDGQSALLAEYSEYLADCFDTREAFALGYQTRLMEILAKNNTNIIGAEVETDTSSGFFPQITLCLLFADRTTGETITERIEFDTATGITLGLVLGSALNQLGVSPDDTDALAAALVPLKYGHYPELCLAWLDTVNSLSIPSGSEVGQLN